MVFVMGFITNNGGNCMAIKSALYKNPNNEKDEREIKIEDFVLEKNYVEMKKHLYCNYSGCEAKISYVPKGKNIAYFKLWKNSKHSVDCIRYYETEAIKSRTSNNLEDENQLSNKQANNIFKDAIKRKNETLGQKILRQKLERERYRLKKQARVDKNSESSKIVNLVKPTTDKNSDIIKNGKRMKTVRKRYNVLDILPKDVGNVILLTDYVSSFELQNNNGTFKIKRKNIVTKIELEESFFTGTELLNISSFLKIVEKAIVLKEKISIMCLGKVELINNEFIIRIFDEDKLRINDLKLDTFAFQYMNKRNL